MNLENKWVLLTGASAGLGEELGLQLATTYKANLVLVARRKDKLEALAQRIRGLGREVVVIAADLSSPTDVKRLYVEVESLPIQAIVLNAGVTYFGQHCEMSAEESQKILNTNLNSVVELSTLFAHKFRRQKLPGGILLVSSLAGSVPAPYQALYSGSKAFLTMYGQALAYELRKDGITVTVFAPGGIATEMTTTSGMDVYFKGPAVLMNVNRCARIALAGFAAGKTFVIPGLMNRFSAALARLVGSRFATRVVGNVYERALLAKENELRLRKL